MTECPDCKVEIKRNYGLPGIVGQCPKCGEEYVKLLDRLVLRKEFHKTVDEWHG